MNRKRENRFFHKNRTIAVILAVSLGVSAFLCACSDKKTIETTPEPTLVSGEQPSGSPTPQVSEIPTDRPEIPVNKSSVQYEKKVFEVNGRQNHVHILTVDLSDSDITVMPHLAFDRIFGFEYLQDMAENTGALAAVNAGFFFEYGRPSGLFVKDSEIISAGTGKFYSLIIDNSSAKFDIVKTDIKLQLNNISIEIESFNKPPGTSTTALFSDAYGSTDRLGSLRKVLIIENDAVREYRTAESAVEIPENGYVIMLPHDYAFESNPEGSKALIEFEPYFSEGAIAYECASMLVEDGVSLAGDTMPWVGNLNHYDPRTCVGIFKDGKLGFVVIDGRTEDSTGTTGRETADILIDLGFADAVMLDGGGSSQMIYQGETVNTPSSGPNGRPIAGGFMIIKKIAP